MFASRTMACAAEDSELHIAAHETFALLIESLEAPAVGLLRERHALQIWAALHGVVMLAEQGLLTGQAAQITREELVEGIVQQTKLALMRSAIRRRRHGCPNATDAVGARGSIGVVPRTPRISSSTLAPASNCASPRGGADDLQSDRQAGLR